MKKLHLIFFLLSWFASDSLCQVKVGSPLKEEIITIAYKVTGNETGGKLDFIISKDSITYKFAGTFNSNSQFLNNAEYTRKKTDSTYWTRLINSINLTAFDKAPQAERVSQIDGIDHLLIITTTKGNHTIVIKADNKINYNIISGFIDTFSIKLKQHKIEIFD